MRDKLILITAGFPFGNHETFLETEIIYLSSAFKKIIILSICDQIDTQREIPENCQVYKIKSSLTKLEKIKSVYYLINKRFWQEIQIIRKTYQKKVSIGIIKTMLISLYNASRIQKELFKHIDVPDGTTCYSYWCDDGALGLGLLKEKISKVTTVCRTHGWDMYFDVHALKYLPFRHFIANQLDTIYPISQKGKEYITEVWRISNPEKVEVSRLGVVAQKKVYSSGIFTIVSCSNLIPLKRVELIILALSAITKTSVNWTHLGDGTEKQRLLQLASDTLGPNVNWEFKGRLPHNEVMQWYRENNPTLLINVSSSEGIPVSIMEAMSFGTPCIATDVGGTAEIVNNENGSLLPEDSTSEEVANTIQEYFDSEVRNRKGKEAFNTWKTKFNAKENYIKFVESLLE